MLTATAMLAVSACKSKAEHSPAPTDSATSRGAALETAQQSGSQLSEAPRDLVWAASSHVRVIDVALGRVVARIDLGHAVNAIEFTAHGERALVAASDGVHELDATNYDDIRQLSRRPARSILRSEDGASLFVLEHEVIVAQNGTREILPFDLVTFDLATGTEIAREEIGQRILRAIPPERAGHHLVITESGEVRLGRKAGNLSDGDPIAMLEGLASSAPLSPRPDVTRTRDGRTAFVPVQGSPARILEVNLESAAVRQISLGEPLLLRGLALTPDGTTLIANTLRELLLIDVAAGKVRGSVDLGAAHQGVALAADGRRAYLARTIDGDGGAITVVQVEPALRVEGKIHLDDITPWVLSVRPRAEFAGR